MIRIVLLLLVVGLFFAVRWWMALPAKPSGDKLRQWLTIGGVLLLAVLALSGRLGWLFGALGVAAAFVWRGLPILIRAAPQLQRLWLWFQTSRRDSGRSGQAGSGQGRGGKTAAMSEAEALEVLGLKIGASQADIVQAHRKLISRVHPDRGGSDYLAARINLAKRVLLKN
ncbi:MULTISPECIES: hypothetical protein [unclassified Methylomonas]|uniref:hypothetical protein n=1 Tax=unclassified Methylomonas TaxID=2608980 RepID=UPI0008D92CD7|nr:MULTISPECIES: hypothetical protein [unclassified Methylomonas]OHX36048.1 hypothetical protein BJL95_09610 [Methylomonas sp. LWB]WGS84533.1 molecular chaperone DnaJ [Methylomonas sp. UP202]